MLVDFLNPVHDVVMMQTYSNTFPQSRSPGRSFLIFETDSIKMFFQESSLVFLPIIWDWAQTGSVIDRLGFRTKTFCQRCDRACPTDVFGLTRWRSSRFWEFCSSLQVLCKYENMKWWCYAYQLFKYARSGSGLGREKHFSFLSSLSLFRIPSVVLGLFILRKPPHPIRSHSQEVSHVLNLGESICELFVRAYEFRSDISKSNLLLNVVVAYIDVFWARWVYLIIHDVNSRLIILVQDRYLCVPQVWGVFR